MDALMKESNNSVHDAGGAIDDASENGYRQQYKEVLVRAEKECPAPTEENKKVHGDDRSEVKAVTCWSDLSILRMMYWDLCQTHKSRSLTTKVKMILVWLKYSKKFQGVSAVGKGQRYFAELGDIYPVVRNME